MATAQTHADHPGFSASDCQHRITITARPTCWTSNGFACDLTGGHCLPGTQACPLITPAGRAALTKDTQP